MKPYRLLCLLAGLAALLVTRPLAAQQTDIIRGRVTGTDSIPLENVVVTVTSLSGNVSRTGRTDRNGRFTVTFPGGDGDYFVSFAALGYAPRRFEVKRTADQDILVADARLTRAGNALDTVLTIGSRTRPPRNSAIPDISGTERAINLGALTAAQMGDLAAMAASLPGVVFIPGANGDPSGFSVLGLGADQNSNTLNGMDFGGANIPRDAAVSSSLTTSPYDVSRGGFSGGQFSIRTQSGSNYIGRSSSLVFDAPQLQWTDPAGRSLGQQYTNANLSGGVSGPISFDKAFYNFSYQLGRRASDLFTLLNTDAQGLQTTGIAKDSVTHLLNILSTQHVPATVPSLPHSRLNDQGTILGAFDFAPPSSLSGQAVNLTVNGTWNKQTPLSALTTELPAHSGDRTSWNGGVQTRHTSYFGFGILSETGASVSGSRNYMTPYLDLPSGSVRVASTFADGTNGVKSIAFGGNPSASTSNSTNSLNLTNTLSWFSENNKHRIKLSSQLRRDAYTQDQTNNQLGSFNFNSLADLQAGQPASFTRALSPRIRSGNELVAALSLGDSYKKSNDLQIQYGVRLDGNRFSDTPTLNPDVERIFGLRNDNVPNHLFLSPRVGFSWTYGDAPQLAAFDGMVRGPRAVVRGGIGLFQNTPGVQSIGSAIDNTGLPSGLQQLTCVGTAAPIPDWNAYATNSASIPTQCADGTGGTVFASSVPNVTLFSRDFAPQKSVRSNLQWNGPILDNRFTATVEGTYSLNLNQQGTGDLNFSPVVRFTLPDEGGRPVFALPTSIVPSTGLIASRDARVTPLFNRVTEMRSDLKSESRQISLRLSPVTFSTSFNYGLSYTYANIRERFTGFNSTVGNPLEVGWGRSSADSRHQIVYNLFYNFFDAVRVSWYGSFRSGNPFTPVISGDVNGDGYSNDRAFIFDPAHTTDPALASSMQSLLASSSGSALSCLQQQLGQLAKRNSCEGPWTSSANMSISFNPIKVRMPQRATLSFQISNPLTGVDLLLHGQNNAHGWGQTTFPDNSLLFVRGFNPQTQRYTYEVNQRFGKTNLAFNALRAPVTLTAMMRVDVGPTRERQALTQQIDRGRKTDGSKLPEGLFKAVYGSGGIVNPMAAILRQGDSLHLTTTQADSIATLNRWYIVHLDSIWSPVAKYLAELPDRYDQDEAYDRYRRSREASVDLLLKIAPDIKRLISPEQRRKLPDIVNSHLESRYLSAIRSGTAGSPGAGFMPGAPLPGMGGDRMVVEVRKG